MAGYIFETIRNKVILIITVDIKKNTFFIPILQNNHK